MIQNANMEYDINNFNLIKLIINFNFIVNNISTKKQNIEQFFFTTLFVDTYVH